MTHAIAPVVRLDGELDAGKDLLGGKAWGINGMVRDGYPVPPAIALPTTVCRSYYSAGRSLPSGVWNAVVDQMRWIEDRTGRTFGRGPSPLLVSVRSGAATSMPGMMDTVLNLGFDDAIEAELTSLTGDPTYVAETRRRFIDQFSKVVGTHDIPDDPWEQLHQCIEAVFDSWSSQRAHTYRRHHDIGEDGGTAVTIQAMVFGNLDDRSGTGVLFSRDPITGENAPYGEWLVQGQGEDVVAGTTTPRPLSDLATLLPDVHAELLETARRLEHEHKDIQDIEFTVESGRLWILQCRNAKRYARAAIHAAVEMVAEGLISRTEAIHRVDPQHVRELMQPRLATHDARLLFTGEPACPGFASGLVVTDTDEAEERGDDESVVLARTTTTPDDLHGMLAARAVVTELGGVTSHAAVVSREIGRACVVGCGPETVTTLAGREVTIDGSAGQIWEGRIDTYTPDVTGDSDLATLDAWLAVHTSADDDEATHIRELRATLDSHTRP